jgi:hypothetical protein
LEVLLTGAARLGSLADSRRQHWKNEQAISGSTTPSLKEAAVSKVEPFQLQLSSDGKIEEVWRDSNSNFKIEGEKDCVSDLECYFSDGDSFSILDGSDLQLARRLRGERS